jgi:CBS domain-containing protein
VHIEKCEERMTRRVHAVKPLDSIQHAREIMVTQRLNQLPVLAEGQLVGIVTDRDIAIRCVADGKDGSCRVRDVMSADDLATCSFGDDVEQVMDAMRTEKVRRIPIVDERGSLVGIVSQADVLRKTRDMNRAGETLEEISEPGGRHAR